MWKAGARMHCVNRLEFVHAIFTFFAFAYVFSVLYICNLCFSIRMAINCELTRSEVGTVVNVLDEVVKNV